MCIFEKIGDDFMPYCAYRDAQKKYLVKASGVTIADKDKIFYCKTAGCKAQLKIVNVADSNRAFFRRLSRKEEHSSILCSADGNFDLTKYSESEFDFDVISSNLMSSSTILSGAVGTGNKSVSGGGGIRPISKLLQIYLMCRKYETYNDINTSDILVDERNFSTYSKGISGTKVAQCTYYHKFKDEFSLRMNSPCFPYPNGKYLKINFSSEKLFWDFYNKLKTSNHRELIIVLGDWKTQDNENDMYMSECIINTKNQIHILKL